MDVCSHRRMCGSKGRPNWSGTILHDRFNGSYLSCSSDNAALARQLRRGHGDGTTAPSDHCVIQFALRFEEGYGPVPRAVAGAQSYSCRKPNWNLHRALIAGSIRSDGAYRSDRKAKTRETGSGTPV
uniref:Uncharacterized protein n=1 Tax=Leishmania guyanensis TaxID=5670 RepID=A0A1E1IZ72_LEIGU|nr:Hypothetical protein BN36_2741210 [Leishmania guyanensis]